MSASSAVAMNQHINVGAYIERLTFLFFYDLTVPLLETLVLHTSFDIDMGDLDDEVGPQLDILLAGAPRLRKFHWDALQFYMDMDPAEFPRANFASLTDLKLTCLLSIDECLAMLARTPLLETCSFNYVREDAPVPFTTPLHPIPEQLLLPRLHTLSLDTDCDIVPFLEAITLPALRSIAIDFRHNMGDLDSPFLEDDFHDWPHDAFMAFLARSKCALSSLSLCVPISEHELGVLLHACARTLKHVTVQGKVGWDIAHERTVRLLTNTRGEGADYFPLLTCVRLYDCIVHPLPPQELANMVHSRLHMAHSAPSPPGGLEVALRVRPDIIPISDEHRLAAMQTLCGKIGGTRLEVETLLRPARVRSD